MTMARIKSDRVVVRSLYAHNFHGLPVLRSPGQITKLEEDKISAYCAGGTLYATPSRLEPQI
jgi:photosynthetic reaction center H subunit